MPEDEDRPRDAASAADPSWAMVLAPDDISSLAADITAYHRELRAARRRELLARIFAHRSATALAMTAVGLALAGAVALLLSLVDPAASHKAPAALPLAPHVSAQSGQLHGLIPDVPLQGVRGTSASSRSLRPAVLALLPLHCECTALLNSFAAAAAAQHLALVVVAPTAVDAEAAALPGQLTQGRPQIYYDHAGALAADFGASGLTLVLLDRDGTVFDVQKAVTTQASTHLSTSLQQMLAATARASG